MFLSEKDFWIQIVRAKKGSDPARYNGKRRDFGRAVSRTVEASSVLVISVS